MTSWRLCLYLAVALFTATRAVAEPSGELLILAPPVLRFAAVEIDGKTLGKLPQPHLRLAPGTHELAIEQGRWRLAASVEVRAGIRAVVRWPRPGPGKVSYPPVMALLMEPGDAPAELRRVAVDSIHRSRFEVLGEYGSPAESVIPAACGETPACLEDLTQLHGLRYILAVQTTHTTQAYALDARLFDADTGDLAARGTEDCPSCSLDQVRVRLSGLCADVLKRGTSRALGLLEITSQPISAEVLVDGRRLGTTPYHRAAGAGEHQIVVHKTGYLDYQNTVDVVVGRGSALDAVLQAYTPTPKPAPASSAPATAPGTLSRRP